MNAMVGTRGDFLDAKPITFVSIVIAVIRPDTDLIPHLSRSGLPGPVQLLDWRASIFARDQARFFREHEFPRTEWNLDTLVPLLHDLRIETQMAALKS